MRRVTLFLTLWAAHVLLSVTAAPAQSNDSLDLAWMSEYDTHTPIADVRARQGIAYLAGLSSGLWIVNTTGPDSTTLLARFDSRTTHVALTGTLACLVGSPSGLLVLDVSDPAAPQLVGSFDSLGALADVAAEGLVACAVHFDSCLQVFNISDSTPPMRVGCTDYWLREHTEHLAMSGNTVVMLSASSPTLAHLLPVDISEPADPIITAELTFAYSSIPWDFDLLGDTLAFVAYDVGFAMFDISDPAHATYIDGFFRGGPYWEMTLRGDLAFASMDSALYVIDLKANPDSAVKASYDVGTTIHGLYVDGSDIYVAHDSGLTVLRVSRKVAVDPDPPMAPSEFALRQNYPNPFNPATMIRFSLDRPALVEVEIFNVLGERVRRLPLGLKSAGLADVRFDGRDDRGRPLASGLYFYRLTAGTHSETKKMILLH